MNIHDIQTLYNYNYWANRRILAASAQLSPEQFVAPAEYSFGSLRSTLAHSLDSEHAWRMLCQHNTLAYFRTLESETLSTVDALVQRWDEEERAMRDYLGQLSDDDLGGYVRYTVEEGKRERLLWHCLLQIVNHGTQHRSEAAGILTGYGCSPGSLDFTAFLNQQSG